MKPSYSLIAAGICTILSSFAYAGEIAPVPENKAPVACFTPKDAAAIKLGDAISFDASCSTDADGSVASYAWLLNGKALGTEKTQLVSFATEQAYRLSLVVTDNKAKASRPVELNLNLTKVFAKTYEAVFVRGSFNQWNKAKMQLTADNTWTAVVKLAANAEFKFDTAPGDWKLSFGDDNADGIAENKDAKNIKVATAGNYKIVFNDKTFAYSLTAVEATEPTSDPVGNACAKPGKPEGAISRGDFDGDGKDDVLWRNDQTGENYLWKMNGEQVATETEQEKVADTDWQVADLADMNGDGKTDVVWRHANGETAVWLMNGNKHQTETLPTVPAEWKLSAADLTGDKKAELVWRNQTTGEDYVWEMNGDKVKAEHELAKVPLDWEIAGLTDADGDGKADITWRNKTKGETAQWFMKDAKNYREQMVMDIPSEWELLSTQDSDGDAKADMLWRNEKNNDTVLLLMDGKTYPKKEVDLGTVPADWEVSNTGDLDGDKKADILWRNKTTGENVAALDSTKQVKYRDMHKVPNEWRMSGDAKCKGKVPAKPTTDTTTTTTTTTTTETSTTK